MRLRILAAVALASLLAAAIASVFAGRDAAARRAPCAELLALDRGGHLLLGAHRDVRARVAAFLAEPPTPDRKSRCARQERQPLRRPFGARIPEPYEA
jgi:hypothetical protein